MTEIPTMFEALIAPLRLLDKLEGNDFLLRFLERPQYHIDETKTRIESLELTDGPATCPADLLEYLAGHVGFTTELSSIVDRLDEAGLRKLIQVAIPLWKLKGTAQGILSVVQFLTGRTPLYADWFDMRYILEETQIGEDQVGTDPWIIGEEISNYDEFFSNLRIADDGSLDEILLLDLLSLMRPNGEQIEVVLLDFLDIFDGSRDRWETQSGTPAVIDTVEQNFDFFPNTSESAIIPIVNPSEMLKWTSVHKFRLGALANLHEIVWTSGAVIDGFPIQYKLELRASGPWHLRLTRIEDSGNTVLVTQFFAGGITVEADTFYKLRIENFTVPDTTYDTNVRVYVDSSLQFDYDDVGVNGGAPGGTIDIPAFTITANVFNSGNNTIDNVEIWRHPMRSAVINKDGVTTSSTFYD